MLFLPTFPRGAVRIAQDRFDANRSCQKGWTSKDRFSDFLAIFRTEREAMLWIYSVS